MLRTWYGKRIPLARSGIFVSAVLAAVLGLAFADVAQAARGGGHGGGGHGGGGHGGGFHGGGGFHAGGFHGGGFHGGGGFRGGGVHAVHAAPHMGRSYPLHAFRSQAVHAPSGISHGVAAANRTVSNRITRRNASAVGHALASRQMRNALRTPGGLRNPMTRAALTAGVAGAAWNHHHGSPWWRHDHGGFGWVGPVFWPYAYYDFYDYAWWGAGYDPLFWDYGYPDLYAGLFGLYDYGALSGYAGYLPGYAGPAGQPSSPKNAEAETSLADMCGSDSRDIAGFPIERFRDAIQPNSEQSAALDDLARVSQKAAETVRNSCPADVALTAPNRLAIMQQRVEAMRSAVTTVQPALDKFYGLLSDEQKAKITGLVADQQPAGSGGDVTSGESCKASPSGATDWPGAPIERDVKPTEAQRGSLTALQDAAAKAANILKSSCPPTDARTPPARLAAVAARLDVMLQAIGTVRPALDNFYNSLTDEQKAAFDAIGPEHGGGTTSADNADDTQQRHGHRRHHHGSLGGIILRMMRL
jgi:hypothetical protein